MILQINRNVGLDSKEDRDCTPEGRHDEFTQHEPEKEGCCFAKTSDPAMFGNNPFQNETHKD